MKDKSIIRFMETTAWAITKDHLDVLLTVVSNHLDGNPVYLKSGDSADSDDLMTMQDGNAVINICGTICKKLYGLEAISGGHTTDDYKQCIQEALDNSSVSGIILNIDSPGGTVTGTKELADFIYESRGKKPIVAFTSGQMCSAAYWIGSAADKMVGFPTASIGSIGVITKHQDWSKGEEAAGLKTTYIYAGKFKSAGNSSEPLEGEAKEYLQASIDDYYTLFVEDIARNLGISVEQAITLADARTHIATKARTLGLIHEVGSMKHAMKVAQTLKGDMKMAETTGQVNVISAEQFATLQATIAEQTKLLADQGSILTALAKEKEDAVAALAAEKTETARKEKLSEITGKLKAVKIDDAALAEALLAVEASTADLIFGKLTGMATQIKELAGELTETTPDAHTTDAEDKTTPATIDAAVESILAEGKITDIDAAIEAASTLYPSLFKPAN